MKNSTESSSNFDHLETMSTHELLVGINREDQTVALAVKKSLAQIEQLVDAVYPKMKAGGRLFYIGAGTSGRLGIVDASECPPTFGVDHGVVVGIIAGGDSAIRKAVEFAEDDDHQAQRDLTTYQFSADDSLIGIAASGRTPYVIGGLEYARQLGSVTGSITCNTQSAVAKAAQYPVEVLTGAEFVTGSTRMKAGTAQKMVLNMISTGLMIKLGHIKGNKMVDMQLSNKKLIERGTKMIAEELHIGLHEAKVLLEKYGSVRKAIQGQSK